MLNNFNYKLGSFGSECRQCILEMNTNRRLRRRRTERERGERKSDRKGKRERRRETRERREEEGGEKERGGQLYEYISSWINSLIELISSQTAERQKRILTKVCIRKRVIFLVYRSARRKAKWLWKKYNYRVSWSLSASLSPPFFFLPFSFSLRKYRLHSGASYNYGDMTLRNFLITANNNIKTLIGRNGRWEKMCSWFE